jgi:psp operon transcriptional activator
MRRRLGRFERADGGTLFLDEIANSTLSIQEKILGVVEYGSFERVGGGETQNVDVRVIAATNEDLPALIQAGRFRADLLDRLAFDVITIPPLRERREDIARLAEHFAVAMSRELGREYFAGFTPAAQAKLDDHPWPGNVRELKNVVERAVYRAARPNRPIDGIVFDPFASPYRPRPAGQPAPTLQAPILQTSSQTGGFLARVRAFEAGLLSQALAENQFNQRKTAEALGLTYDQLRHHMKKHRLRGD